MIKQCTWTIALVLFSSIAFSGCPAQGSPAVGFWAIALDANCDGTKIYFLVVLHADNTAEFYSDRVDSGTWGVNGSNVMLTFPTLVDDLWVFTGTLNNDLIVNGSYTRDGMGTHCWTAQKESF